MTTRLELAARLRRRYDEQCERFPKTREITWGLYKRRNLPHIIKLDQELALWDPPREALEMYRL